MSLRFISLQPSSGPVKYLQMAQLEDGSACLPLYRTAISMLESSLASVQSSSAAFYLSSKKAAASARRAAAAAKAAEEQQLKVDLTRAYCSVAELYLTDLCDAAEAEQEATAAIQKALQLIPDSPDALLCDAQIKKVKGKLLGLLL